MAELTLLLEFLHVYRLLYFDYGYFDYATLALHT